MRSPFKLSWKNQTLWLSPESCLFWEEEQALIVSDIHFGKSGHFRKEGIGIPQTVFKEDLQRLITQVLFFKAKQLLVVGDFFHSRMNSEMLLFEKWRNDLSALPIHLIKGNHDILEHSWYKKNKIELHEEQLHLQNFSFVHEMNEESLADDERYFFSGHIHPGISISGLGKQSLRFPCFYFSETHAVLPAFGKFTGLHPVKPKKKDKVFAIVNKSVLEIN